MKKLLTICCAMLIVAFVFADTITIGTGTSVQRYPLGSFFGYERSAALYTDAELGSQISVYLRLPGILLLLQRQSFPRKYI